MEGEVGVVIRQERAADSEAIRTVNQLAFDRSDEGQLVDRLRQACDDYVSLVATVAEQVVGHIFFTPATAFDRVGAVRGMGLAPLAVLPDYQGQGIGSQLVEAGLNEIRNRKMPFVIVVGHPSFYPRFGFQPASRFGLLCQWEGVPDEAFMVAIVDEGVMARVSGVVRYRDEFDELV